MTTNKDEIFDWVATFEDQCLENVREEVIKTAEYNFGKTGREVAEHYYRLIDGEEEPDYEFQKDCDDCREKAKRLIENAETLKTCADVLASDLLTNITKDLNSTDIENCINKESKRLLNDTCFDVDANQEILLKIRIILEIIKRKLKTTQ